MATPDVSAPAPKKVRKPRAAKKGAAPRAGKIGIHEIVLATTGLKTEEAKALLSLVNNLSDLNKSGKSKVVGALARLFA